MPQTLSVISAFDDPQNLWIVSSRASHRSESPKISSLSRNIGVRTVVNLRLPSFSAAKLFVAMHDVTWFSFYL